MARYLILLLLAGSVQAQTVILKVLNFPDNQFYTEPGAGPGGGTQAMNLSIVSYGQTWGADLYLGEGDNYQYPSNTADQTNIPAWVSALQATGITFISPPGNHDYDDATPGILSDARLLTAWSTHVGGPMAAQSAYMGSYPGSGNYENMAFSIGTHGGIPWGVITLGYCPTNEALTWANGIVSANPTLEFIVSTHNYVNDLGTLANTSSSASGNITCQSFGVTTDFNYGQQIWDKFVSLHDNQIRLVVNGHFNPPSNFSARRRDVGTHGYGVDEVYFDAQGFTNGGNGFIRLLSFYSDGTIGVQTYSPVTTTFMTDAQNQFTLAAQVSAAAPSAISGNIEFEGNFQMKVN